MHMISLLAFGLPYIPFTNAKCRIVGSASNTPAVASFLQGVGEQGLGNQRLCVAEDEAKR